jgi:hypothetical protein
MSAPFQPTESAILDTPFEDTRSKASRYRDRHREPFDPNRKGKMITLSGLLGSTAIYPEQKTYAPSPCWRDSTTKPVKWQHMTPAVAKEIYRQAEDFERQTRQPGHQDGAIGRNGLAVLRAMIFGFLNYKTGQLDPGYKAIAAKACISIRSVARGLAKLKLVGVLNWVRRCIPNFSTGVCVLEQDTNAYGILPASQWLGYRPSPRHTAPLRPERGTWGDHPSMPSPLEAASTELREGGTGRGIIRELENDPGDTLAKALACFGRALGIAEMALNPDVPA